jgi:acyl-CoA thioesterase
MAADPTLVAQAVKERLCELDGPVMALLGLVVESVTPDKAVVTMTVRPDMVNSHSYCHGGLVFTLADHAFAYACCAQNRTGVTLASHILFLQAAQLGDGLTAVAHLLDLDDHQGWGMVEVTNQKGVVVARYRGTWYRLAAAIVPNLGNGENLQN